MTLLSCRVIRLLALSLSTGRFSLVNILVRVLIKASAFILVEELCIYTFVCYRVPRALYIGKRAARCRLFPWMQIILIVVLVVVLSVVRIRLPALAMAPFTWTIWLFSCSFVRPVGPIALVVARILEKFMISVFLENTPILKGALYIAIAGCRTMAVWTTPIGS